MRKKRKLHKSFIYIGRCLTTNKVYVGGSRATEGKRRPLTHVRDLKKQRHSNDYLQKAWNKYGEADFEWHIVELCSETTLIEREMWWIGFMRATDPRYGFNLNYPTKTWTKAVRTHLSKTMVEIWKDPEVRGKRLSGLRKLHKDEQWKSRRSIALSKRWKTKKFRDKMYKVLARNVTTLSDRMTNDPEFKKHRMRGIQPQKED